MYKFVSIKFPPLQGEGKGGDGEISNKKGVSRIPADAFSRQTEYCGGLSPTNSLT